MPVRISRLTWCKLERSISITAIQRCRVELFSYLKQGKNMKNLYGKVVLAAFVYAGVMAEVLANPFCGGVGEPSCEVPEPSTAYLFLGAAAVAGIVTKFRKKK